MKISFQWENLGILEKDGFFHANSRARVPGGWIVKNISGSLASTTQLMCQSTVFIADVMHEWEIEEEKF